MELNRDATWLPFRDTWREKPDVWMEKPDAGQIDQIVSLVRDVLGQSAVGAYLHGSTALDELRPHSDIDVLVVSRRATTPEEKRVLIDRLLRMSRRGDPSGQARSIELTIVVESEIRPWRYPPRFDFQYGDWLRSEFESGDLTPWETPNPDLAPMITMVRSGNRPLFGPPPTELFDPVPPSDLNRAIVEGIPGLLDDLDSDTGNVVLTFARIWTTLATGAIRSKDAAADWARTRLPEEHRAVLDRARAVYVGDEEERWDDLHARVRPHVEHVLREIERLAAREPSTEPGDPPEPG
jgi:predicted nucleotidyltransferase